MMGKKNLTKTEQQKRDLETFYQMKNDCWTRSEIVEFSRRINLTRQQVYKWLWDRRNQVRQKETNNQVKKEDIYIQNQKWRKVAYKKFILRVPRSKHNASCFVVNHKVSSWVVNVLKLQGWQLIREKPQIMNEYQSYSSHEDQSSSKKFDSSYLVKQEQSQNNYQIHSQSINHEQGKIDQALPISPIGRYCLRKRPLKQKPHRYAMSPNASELQIYQSDD